MGTRNCRDYLILFLLQETEKRVYMECSFAQDLGAVLRKHWHGDNVHSAEFFSLRNPEAVPEMLAWRIGYVDRNAAKIFLRRWASAFRMKGYQVFGELYENAESDEIRKLDFLTRERLMDIDPDQVIRGDGVEIITCGQAEPEKKSGAQKYAAEPADTVLNIRTTGQMAEMFRTFCEENQVTQNQGLAMLLATGEEDARTCLKTDLRERLNVADAALKEKECEIAHLKEQLAAERQKKKESRLDHLARLQNSLLHCFLVNLPTPVFSERQMKCWSARSSKTEFPEAKAYSFPDREGVLLLRLEHVRYEKGNSGLLVIYGRSEKGERLKLLWRITERNRFGESVWQSPYLIKGYPWLFAVSRPREIAYGCCALPLFDLDRITQWYEAPDDDDSLGLANYYEVPVFNTEAEENPEFQAEPVTEEPDPMLDSNAALEDKIRAAKHKKRF